MTQSQSPDNPNTPREGHVIVAGFGPVGRLCADELEATGMRVTILELSLDTIQRQLHLDKDVVYGSTTDEAALRTAGIDKAAALILAIPDEDVALQACTLARSLNPAVFIAARTNFMSQGMLCQAAGADQVIVEEVVTAEAMRKAVVQRLTDGPSA